MTTLSRPSTGAAAAPRPIRRRLIGAIVVLAVLLIGWLVGFSSLLGARTVTVTGVRLLTAEQVRRLAAVPPGAPLVRLDTAGIARRIEALPEVRAVAVHLSYPGTVDLRVFERVPVGWQRAGTRVRLVDASGVAFWTQPDAPAGLPRIDTTLDRTRALAMAQVAGSLPPPVAQRVSHLSAPSAESITLQLRDGRTVLWGGTDRSADKARLLPALFGQPGTYFDVSDPDTVISRGAPTN
jgi:cell division protein FtsQ